MVKKCNKEIETALIECHILLNECVLFKNIENKELICNNLNMLREYRNRLPEDIYSQIDQFAKDVVAPIAFDADYFSFLRREEFGECNDKGHFVINSERSLETMIFLMYHHSLSLAEKVNRFATEVLKLDYYC